MTAIKIHCNLIRFYKNFSKSLDGRDSSVGIATRYGLDCPDIESRGGGGRFSAPAQTGPGAHPASCTIGTGSFLGVKRPGRCADPHPHLQCRVLKYGRTIPLPTLRALVACKGETFTFLFFHSLYIVHIVWRIFSLMSWKFLCSVNREWSFHPFISRQFLAVD